MASPKAETPSAKEDERVDESYCKVKRKFKSGKTGIAFKEGIEATGNVKDIHHPKESDWVYASPSDEEEFSIGSSTGTVNREQGSKEEMESESDTIKRQQAQWLNLNFTDGYTGGYNSMASLMITSMNLTPYQERLIRRKLSTELGVLNKEGNSHSTPIFSTPLTGTSNSTNSSFPPGIWSLPPLPSPPSIGISQFQLANPLNLANQQFITGWAHGTDVAFRICHRFYGSGIDSPMRRDELANHEVSGREVSPTPIVEDDPK